MWQCDDFRRVRKISKSYYSFVSVRLCAWNNSSPTGRILMKFDIWVLLEKIYEKIRVSLKWDNTNSCFTWRLVYIFLSNRSQFFLEWEMGQTKVVEEIKTHVLCSVTFFFFFRKSCRLWRNVEKYCRAGRATYGSMAHAHCMLDN